MRVILTLEYDGTPFRGWAPQPGLPSVEAALRQQAAGQDREQTANPLECAEDRDR